MREQETQDIEDQVVVFVKNTDKIVRKGRKLLMKFSPALFCDMIRNLSSSQREWVSRTGFGSILNFRLQNYPKYLSYNIVNNFDSDSCSIVVEGETLKIS